MEGRTHHPREDAGRQKRPARVQADEGLPTGNDDRSPRLLLAASFLSGVAALNYELLWVRELTLLAGSTQAAISCVLSVYFLGLALGNEIAGRVIHSLRRPLVVYATAELGIAFWALLFLPLFAGLGGFYASLYKGLAVGSPWIHVLRLSGSAFLVLLPTACMGATLPLLAQSGARDLPGASRWTAKLYGLNTMGAMVGAFVTGFLLIEHLGVSLALRLTALLNLGAALCVMPGIRRSSHERERDGMESVPSRGGIPRFGMLLLISFGILGFANIAVEVLWTSFFALIYPNDTYVFTTILLVYLFGVGAGSLLGQRLLTRIQRPVLTLGILQMASAAATIWMIYSIPPLVISIAPRTLGFGRQVGHYFAGVAAGTVIQTLCMGASFPLLIRAVLSNRRQTGRIVGAALAWNTIGGVLGAWVGGFLFLDRLGLQSGLMLTAALTALVGLALSFALPSDRRAASIRAAVIVVPVLLVLIARPPRLPDSLLEMHFPDWAQMRLLETRPSVHGLVAITEERGDIRKVWINSTWVASERAHLAFGYAPWLLHRGPVRSALGICCGTGRTFGALLNAGIQDLDLVDINRAVIDLSSKWLARSNHGVLTNPRVRVIIDDGRNFMRYGSRNYDLITLEPLQMFQKGVVYFYTQEFYRDARTRLAEDGVVCQWVPLNLLSEHEFLSLIKTFLRVFPNSLLWGRRGHSLVLLGYNSAGEIPDFSEAEVYARMAIPSIQADLAQEEMLGKYDPFVYTLIDGAGLAAMSRSGEIYTDDRPTLEFTAPRGRYAPDRNLELVKRHLVSLDRVFQAPDDRTRQAAEQLRARTLDMYAPRADVAQTRQAIQEARRRLYGDAG